MDICFDSNLNIIVGNNAQGKSNILESIFVLALTKSYINVKDHYLINDEKEFSVIKGEFSTDDVEKELEVVITQNSKKLKVNHVEVKKYSDYIRYPIKTEVSKSRKIESDDKDKEPDKDDTADTGDDSNMLPWAIMAVTTLLAALGLMLASRRKA